MSAPTSAAERAEALCVGLSLPESAALAALLPLSNPEAALARLDGPGARALHAALRRAPHNDRAALASATLDRLAEAPALGLRRLHAGWRDRLQRHERREATAALFDPATATDSDAAAAAQRWLAARAAQLAPPLDPRHLRALSVGGPLEPAQLRLASHDELARWLRHLGAALLARATHGAAPRELAALAARLPAHLRDTFLAARAPADLATRLLHRPLRRAADEPERGLLEVGLAAIALAGAGRHRDALLGLASALEPDLGDLLLRHLDARADTTQAQEIAPDIWKHSLTLWQDLAARGQVEPHWGARPVALQPPQEPL